MLSLLQNTFQTTLSLEEKGEKNKDNKGKYPLKSDYKLTGESVAKKREKDGRTV